MSAIRNIGELASPYFLLEVWARRDEIDIDPETYASLKRKARSLVRDARRFEIRGEEPDEEWRARRLDLLSLEGITYRTFKLEDGTEYALGIYRDEPGNDAVLVSGLPGFDDADRRTGEEADPASTRFELAVDAYDGDADWGLLLAGLEVRIYRRSSGISQQYLALDLDTLVELDDEPAWKAFAAMFRCPAFVNDTDGVPLIRRVVDESRRHASALASDMRSDVVDAAEAIVQGALDHPANATLVGDQTRSRLHGLFEESLYLLYRVLFVLYAEARQVLPVSGRGAYARSYSVDHLVELARRGGASTDGRYFHDTLMTLFSLLAHGPQEAAHRLGFEPVGGELFDPDRTETLTMCVVPDTAWERALTSIALGAPESARRKLGRRSSFAELGVDQLGSIYEGLLVMEPYLATETAYLGTYKGERRVFPSKDIEGFRVQRHLRSGDFVLEAAGARRKGTGSFYTPHEITEYLSRAAIDPILEPIMEKSSHSPEVAASELLALNVLDPAMGSGAFLVQAARVLALALARIRAAGSDGLVTPDRVHHAKREVVRHCLYGVDLNPLAVVLAKVSLWLETLEPGKPLTFLDAHLRCGDSLIGVNFVTDSGDFTASELASYPLNARKGLETYLKSEAGERGEPVLVRLKNTKVPNMARQAQLPGIDRSAIETALEDLGAERERIATLEEGAETLFEAARAQEAFEQLEAAEDSARNRLRQAADFWCAQWFNDGEDSPEDKEGPVVPASYRDFELVVAALIAGEAVIERLEPLVSAAAEVVKQRRFFHWALEFPEVMVRRRGFDAVIGNPPWNTTGPDPREYFGTFDPVTFAKRGGASDAARASRTKELRVNPEIDQSWRRESRFLHELLNYSKPDAGRFFWFAPNGQLRKGDANVFRLFVEQAFRLVRHGGSVCQVLPDSVYVSAPATGIRLRILDESCVRFLYSFENRKRLFPIDIRSKVVLLGAEKGTGPTDSFRAAFFCGKRPDLSSRAVSVEQLPAVLAALDMAPPSLSRAQIELLMSDTLAFPELQTPLDSATYAKCARRFPVLGDEKSGWDLEFCIEYGSTTKGVAQSTFVELEENRAKPKGLGFVAATGEEWWPLVEGSFYQLEFPAVGKRFETYLRVRDLRTLKARTNPDGSLTMEHWRVVWRKVTSPTNERGAIATVLPPDCVAKESGLTVRGGHLRFRESLVLASLLSSFVFDYLVRFSGRVNLTYSSIRGIPVPPPVTLGDVIPHAWSLVATHLRQFQTELPQVDGQQCIADTDWWRQASARAYCDAVVARAYGLDLDELAALLLSFPNLDMAQPMLPGEPKCFVTRDLVLDAFCGLTSAAGPDIGELMRTVGSGLSDPAPEYRDLRARLDAYSDLGAVPYRPTPKGGRVPTDPSLVDDVVAILSANPVTASEVAEGVGAEEDVVAKVLHALRKSDGVYSEGRGKKTRYYVTEDV